MFDRNWVKGSNSITFSIDRSCGWHRFWLGATNPGSALWFRETRSVTPSLRRSFGLAKR
jgi:hypothetical protein